MSTSKTTTIPAVAYVRKSTRGKRTGGGEKQEHSLTQQREEVIKLAREKGCDILRWYEDEGISGWKRDAARPGFAKMLADAREKHDFKAIVVDDMDRFSRADARKVIRDVDDLADAGVTTIHAVCGGDFRIGDATDPGEMHRLVAVAMANHEYSRKLSRRVTLARRNAAKEGKRTGGRAPYGLKDDGAGGLVHGNAAHAAVVRWLFEQYGSSPPRTLNWLAGDLNRRKVPAPEGGLWQTRTIAGILRRPAYRGDFAFNRNPDGQFSGIDAKGEVVEKVRMDKEGRLFRVEGKYEPLVDPALFDRVQERLAEQARKVRPGDRRQPKYALSGILRCGHCGSPMCGMPQRTRGSSPTVYRCSGNQNKGKGHCEFWAMREDRILPFVLKLLGEEIKDLAEVQSRTPESIRAPYRERLELRRQKEQEREELAAAIGVAEDNMLKAKDPRTFKSLEDKVTAARDRLDQLDAELADEPRPGGFTQDEFDALLAWHSEFMAKAVSMPVPERLAKPVEPGEYVRHNAFGDGSAVLVDPLVVNEKLQLLGCRVTLWWKTKEVPTRAGNTQRRHELLRGRFRLGQQQGALPRGVLEPAAPRRYLPSGRDGLHRHPPSDG
jgi:site-specific DNA recombinase